MKLIFLILSMSFSTFVLATKPQPYWIYFAEIDRYIVPNAKQHFPDTTTIDNVFGNALITCFNYKGRSIIKNYYHTGKIQMEGQYCESIGLLKKYFYEYDIESGKQIRVIREYYQPIPDGKWKYFDFNGVLQKEITFVKGAPSDSVIYVKKFFTEFNKSYSINFWQDSLAFRKGERELLDTVLVNFFIPVLFDTTKRFNLLISSNISEKEYANDPLIAQKRCVVVIKYLISEYGRALSWSSLPTTRPFRYEVTNSFEIRFSISGAKVALLNNMR